MESVYIFYDHLVHVMAIWYNLWQFGKVCAHLVYFPHFGTYVWTKKNLATLIQWPSYVKKNRKEKDFREGNLTKYFRKQYFRTKVCSNKVL
jgi:hypothetical protein